MYFANFANSIDVTCKWKRNIKVARGTLCESEVLRLHDGPYVEVKYEGCTMDRLWKWYVKVARGTVARGTLWSFGRKVAMTGPRVKVARGTFVESPKNGQCLLDHTRRLHEEPYREGTVVNGRKVNLEVVARTTGFRLRSWKHRPYVDWQTALYS